MKLFDRKFPRISPQETLTNHFTGIHNHAPEWQITKNEEEKNPSETFEFQSDSF